MRSHTTVNTIVAVITGVAALTAPAPGLAAAAQTAASPPAAQTVAAQTAAPDQPAPLAASFLDPVGGLTLTQAIERALAQEPSLRAARSEVDVARGLRLQAALRPNPTVSVDQQAEPGGTDSETRIEVRWPLDLFRKAGRVNVADREIEATQHAIADRERRLIADVRVRYGEVASAVRELSVTDDLVAALVRQHRLVSARVDEGAAPPLDRDVLRVERQRLDAERVLRSGQAERALIELKRLLGLAPDVPVKLRDDLEQLVQRETATTSRVGGLPPASRPDVDEADARVRAADAQIDRTRREARIDLSLVGMYLRSDAGFPQRAFGPEGDLERVRGTFHYLSAGVMLMMPLRDRNQGAIAAAQAQRARAEAQRDAARLTAQAEIAAARVRDDHARRALAAYAPDTRALAKQNLDVVSQTYELGRMTLFDVITEQRRYLEIERAYTAALREAYEARQELRRALGDVR